MATSQNGGLVLDYGDPRLITTYIPGTNARFVGGVAGEDLNLIFMYIGHRWNTEIEPVVAYGCWGFNVRAIRGQTSGYSNHASGTAVDINAPQHPLGTQTLGATKLAALRKIASDLIGVIRFGAFYNGRKDEMHAEKIGTDSQVSALADRIRRGELPNTPAELLSGGGSTPAPTPAPSPGPAPSTEGGNSEWPLPAGHFFGTSQSGYEHNGTGSQMSKNFVAEFQDKLNKLGYNAGEPDGIFGSKTKAATLAWQQRVVATVGAGPRNIQTSALCGPNDWYAIHETLYQVRRVAQTPTYPGLLDRGSVGASVRQMQTQLNKHLANGYGRSITVDGDYGPATEAAVRWFQRVSGRGLSVDGKVGPATWRELFM